MRITVWPPRMKRQGRILDICRRLSFAWTERDSITLRVLESGSGPRGFRVLISGKLCSLKLLRVERPMPLTARTFPQRSRSQGRPKAAALAGLPLDGGESEGKLKYVGVDFFETSCAIATNQLVLKKTL
jgi:hypothetical protein